MNFLFFSRRTEVVKAISHKPHGFTWMRFTRIQVEMAGYLNPIHSGHGRRTTTATVPKRAIILLIDILISVKVKVTEARGRSTAAGDE